MSTWCCTACGYTGDFVEFKDGSVEYFDHELGEMLEEDTVECPQCGHDGAAEL